MHVLVLNSGSSSIKFCLYDMKHETMLARGKIEQIGEPDGTSTYWIHTSPADTIKHRINSSARDHATGLQQLFSFLQDHGFLCSSKSLYAIGHRVVHGGDTFQKPTIIGEKVMDGIRALIPMAPLHNPANLTGIELTQSRFPQVPQVAVFDTAFFHDLPPYAHRYAVPDNLYRSHHIRRYGFHGTSHQHVAREAAKYLQRPLGSSRFITLHLGNGASAAAILDGACIDTSMGMTPLEGLIMGTRCGDLDPSIHFYLARECNMKPDEIEFLLNHESGLKGICGASDMREVHQLADQGDKLACLAIEMYCHRISKYVGAYAITLGGLDALIFTAGIGENDAQIRENICSRLGILGITLDQMNNQTGAQGIFDISSKGSKVRILVVPTNEELEIARQTVSALDKDALTC